MEKRSATMVFFFSSVCLHFLTLSFAQPSFPGAGCSKSAGNYTTDSPYQKNLLSTFYSIINGEKGNYGFYNLSFGQEPDRVNTIALCRGDVSVDVCQRCLQNATQQIQKACPNQKEAFGWYLDCMIHYANRSIYSNFGTLESLSWYYRCNETFVANNEYKFAGELKDLLYNLRSRAAAGDLRLKFATGNGTADSRKIYALVQCTPDLSKQDCNDCLYSVIEKIPEKCEGYTGARVYNPSCNVRFAEYPFFNQTLKLPPLVSPSPSSALFPPLVSPSVSLSRSQPEGKRGYKSQTVIIFVVPIATVLLLAIVGLFVFCRRRKQMEGVEREGANEDIVLPKPKGFDHYEGLHSSTDEHHSVEMHCLSFSTIQAATNNFSDKNKLGEGGFGPVYKGQLPNGNEIAVKRLSMRSTQGLDEFKTEVKLLIKLQHKNLVRLLGYCLEADEKLLVYEFMANTSLDAFLFDPTKSKPLNWDKRVNIIKGTARGLLYLHEDSRLKIIHRDLKASNVLLDDEMNPKISDFGTARIFGSKQMEANTERIVGTCGYIAPEYGLEGIFSIKSDVYSFGVLVLEIISGKKNKGIYDPEQGQNLLLYGWRLWNERNGVKFIDPNIVEACDMSEALRWIHIALLCVQDDPADRPTMSSVVLMLASKSMNLPQPSTPPYSAARFTKMLDQYEISEHETSTGSATGFHASSQTSTSNTSL